MNDPAAARPRYGPLKKALLLLLLGAAVLGTLVGHTAWRYLHDTSGNAALVLEISPGSSFARILRELESQALITRPLVFKAWARYTGMASQIKAGEYEIPADISPVKLLELLVSGRVLLHQFTIVEGWTFAQLREQLALSDAINHQTRALSDAELMAVIGKPDIHPEGQFLPDTYSFARGTSDSAFLLRAYDSMQTYLAEAWPERNPDIPLKTPYEALILASIVEKETGQAFERPMIAGVFVSRLNKNMKLQTDPTVIYGMGDAFDGNIRRRDLRRDTPYNTYTRRGLTPTPIALAGRAAIDAVLHPAETDALFFVSRNDGTHKFSRTLAEHEAAVDKYQRNR